MNGSGNQIQNRANQLYQICDWLTSHGIAVVLLNNRVPGSGPHRVPELHRHVVPKVPTALDDAQVTVEMHSYPEGQHACGLRRTEFPRTGWVQLMEIQNYV
jgi:hypothetical protein